MTDRIADVWGERTPFAVGGDWPDRVDQALTVDDDQVERWVQSACVLCSNGCGMDIAVADGRIVGVRGRAGGPGQPGPAGPQGNVRVAGEPFTGPADPAADPGREPVEGTGLGHGDDRSG
jgi:anaerobic selenocysteine-containing dehydrogenase